MIYWELFGFTTHTTRTRPQHRYRNNGGPKRRRCLTNYTCNIRYMAGGYRAQGPARNYIYGEGYHALEADKRKGYTESGYIATEQGDAYYSDDLAFKDHVNIDVS